jgi:hypothetical protein
VSAQCLWVSLVSNFDFMVMRKEISYTDTD